MILRMRPEGIRHVPVVLCSMCMQEIEQVNAASIAYRLDGRIDKRVFALHNGCIDSFQAQAKIDELSTVPLACFPIYLINALDIDFEQASAEADALSRV